MADARHFEKKENIHNSAAIWVIFIKFGLLMVIDSAQRPRMWLFGYNKVQDGGILPYWKTDHHNNSPAVSDIVEKFCMTNNKIITALN